MITEKRFASSHHAFWHDLLPMGEHYIRSINLRLSRFQEPMQTVSPPETRGIANELAFRLFVRSTRDNVPPNLLDGSTIAEASQQASSYIKQFRQHLRGNPPVVDGAIVREAAELAQRTVTFFRMSADQSLALQPVFQGCGWLSECCGDVLGSKTLYEIKAGERLFRMLDVRQVLIYCALNFEAKSYDIVDVCLVNPRDGTYFSLTLENLCDVLSGRSAADVLSEIVEYISESSGREHVE